MCYVYAWRQNNKTHWALLNIRGIGTGKERERGAKSGDSAIVHMPIPQWPPPQHNRGAVTKIFWNEKESSQKED
jgi:hypothetical protein